MEQSHRSQVLVIGGGPAGSTSATLLAREGFDVVLVEKETFPRYHIGESLLPSVLEICDLIGAREKMEAHGFVRKHGGFFAWGEDSWILNFEKLRHPYGFQVVRSEFDQILLEHAKSQGVRVVEGQAIRAVHFDGDRPVAATGRGSDGSRAEYVFDYLIDASGRAGVLSSRYLKNRRFHEAFQNVAVWGYWDGAGTMAFAPDGAIAVGSVPDGWLWGIPLHDGTMSVGLVLHRTTFAEKRKEHTSLEAMLLAAVAESPLITDLLRPGTFRPGVRADKDFSYIADSVSGPGYFLAGDAACFIDPLLSTGVHLATHGALLAAAAVASALRGEVSDAEAADFYEQGYRTAYLRLMVIISGLYQLYDGKRTYFWKAQHLTHHDYDNADAMNEAFLYVVSGMEDVKDTGQRHRELDVSDMVEELDPEEAERTAFMLQVYNKVFYRSAMSPEEGSGGLYVRTEPYLGLARSGESAARTA
jgi:flavin-dependent dehydrogenase